MKRVLGEIVIVFGSGDFFSLLINKRSLNWKWEPQWEFILLLVHARKIHPAFSENKKQVRAQIRVNCLSHICKCSVLLRHEATWVGTRKIHGLKSSTLACLWHVNNAHISVCDLTLCLCLLPSSLFSFFPFLSRAPPLFLPPSPPSPLPLSTFCTYVYM